MGQDTGRRAAVAHAARGRWSVRCLTRGRAGLLGGVVVLWLGWLLGVAQVAAAVPTPVRHYLLLGEATDAPTPHRACAPGPLEGRRQQLTLPAPPGGWSGQPQALDVFNVLAGEVSLQYRDRRICGNMSDARTRDSRFRAGIGMVIVPPAGSTDPIVVSWPQPLKERWGPTLLLGAPSPVQQNDTARLLVRAACIAVALALALSALMGWLSARDRAFLIYVGICVASVLWQAAMSGLSGYPEPWLPLDWASAPWLVALSSGVVALLLPVLWWLNGGLRHWPGSRRGLRILALLLAGLVVLVPWLDWRQLGAAANALEGVYILGCGVALGAGLWSWAHRDRWANVGLAALLPFLLMIVADLAEARWLLAYRVEVLQLSVTWLLMMAAYALNQRLGRLREQRDEMRQLADTDALTGLGNRRAGLRELAARMDLAGGEGQPLAIGFLDIDLFKEINDRHGHDVGDAVLIAVAAALRGCVRRQEEVFRMGGEEFLLMLPGCTGAQAAARLEQVRLRINEAGATLQVEGLQLTASIGLAQWRRGRDDLAGLLRRADHAMYAAKRAGRDRVMDGEQLEGNPAWATAARQGDGG